MTGTAHRALYRDSGVDVSSGDALVDAIRPLADSTRRAGCIGSIGGFGAAFDLSAAGFRDPLLVSAADGVGTKLRIAIDSGRLETIGIDLVAMCVNDLVCHGAEPLYVLDYFAAGKLEPVQAKRVIAGIAAGCRTGGVALVGGETAEMPGMYPPGEFDLAGFAVGAVERNDILPRPLAIGDAAIALMAEGPHANGYSLIRRIVAKSGLSWSDPAPFRPEAQLGEALLEPTAIYVKPALALARAGHARAFAHITGGGLAGNLPRVLGPDQAVRINPVSWPLPPVFRWIMAAGGVSWEEMLAVFNCGVGMVAVCPEDRVESAIRLIGKSGFESRRIGVIVPRVLNPVEFSDLRPPPAS